MDLSASAQPWYMRLLKSIGRIVFLLALVLGVLYLLIRLTNPMHVDRYPSVHGTLDSVYHCIEVAMAEYCSNHGSFPPTYGFIDLEARQRQLDQTDPDAILESENVCYHLKPYLAYLNLHGVEDVHDLFGESYDVNQNGQIDLHEYSPVGTPPEGSTDKWLFPDERFNGSNNAVDVALQLRQESRPVFYAPVNLDQFEHAKAYWLSKGDFQAATWDASDPLLKDVRFPPAKYDAYVLISIGPGESLFGVVPEDRSGVSNIPVRDMYHVQAMRTYFLATRDMNDNQLLDYDFYARTK
jgi:hypothetical protein